MCPPARRAIRPSTSSPSRNKRSRRRKKSPGSRAFFMGAPKEGGLSLLAANAHSSTEPGRFYILRLHGQAKSVAGTGTATGRAVERGGEPVPRRSGSLVVPVFGKRRRSAARGEGAEGQGGPGRARSGAKAGRAPQGGIQRRKAVLEGASAVFRHSRAPERYSSLRISG